jgi:phage terminase small subunit
MRKKTLELIEPLNKDLNLDEIPLNLSEESKAIWRKVQEGYNIDITLYCYLKAALENLDEAKRMTEIINEDGLTVKNKRSGVVKVHPLLSMRDKCYSQFSRNWNLCGLDLEEPGGR